MAFAVAGTFLFASKSILAKWVYALGGDATELLTLRMVYAWPFYAVVLGRSLRTGQKDGGATRVSARDAFVATGLGFFGYYLASYLDLLGLEFVSAQLERLTLFTYPALTSLLAWRFLGESLSWRTAASISLCFAGVALMYHQETKLPDASEHSVAWGILLVAGAAVSYSAYVVAGKPLMRRLGSSTFTSLAMIGSGGFVVAHYAALRDWSGLMELDGRVHLWSLVLAVGCTVVPSYLINAAVVRIGASRTSIIGTAGPVLTVLLAIVVLGESSSAWHFVGMALAIAGVTVVAR